MIFDDENNNEELMPNSEKAKCLLVDNPLEAIELYFQSLRFQDMAQSYKMKNIRGLKHHHDFKRQYPVEAPEKIQKTRKISVEKLRIREHQIRKQCYWAMRLDNISGPPKWPWVSWPLVRLFWHKNDLGACLDAWAKYDPLWLNECNP